MDNKAIEQEIQDKGLTAPRVTLAHVEGCIASEYYFSALDGASRSSHYPEQQVVDGDYGRLGPITFCVLVLKNGFTVTGETTCVSRENFDAELGRKIARQNAVSKIWMLEGYLLKDHLYNKLVEERNGGGDFSDS